MKTIYDEMLSNRLSDLPNGNDDLVSELSDPFSVIFTSNIASGLGNSAQICNLLKFPTNREMRFSLALQRDSQYTHLFNH